MTTEAPKNARLFPAPGLAHSSMPEAWRDLQQRCSAVEAMLQRGDLEERLGGTPQIAAGRLFWGAIIIGGQPPIQLRLFP